MSRVFVATEVSLGRRVVIKVLPPELAASVNVERFRREIRLAAGLQHPAIVPLLAADSTGELLWFSMPFVEGESLRARLARTGELPIDEAVRLWRDVLEALEYAHAQGVVHRDIKPENVLLTGRHAVVTDFGVAKALTAATGAGSATATGFAIGTPAYMAPEQAAGDTSTDARADLYAAGLVMYELLCGRGPFDATTPQALIAAQVATKPASVAERRDSVPARLAELVMQCLAKRPADRPQRAADVLASLDGLAGEISGVRTPTRGATGDGGSSIPRRRRARRMIWIAAAATAIVATAVVLRGGIGGIGRASRAVPDSLRLRVFVAPFRYEPADSMLARAATSALMAPLQQDGRLGVWGEAAVRGVLTNFGIEPSAATTDTVVFYGRNVASQVMVSGTIAHVGSSLLLSADIRTARDDSSMGTVQLVSEPAKFPEALKELAGRVQAVLDGAAGRLPRRRLDFGLFAGQFHTSPEAARAFGEGVNLFMRRENLASAAKLREATGIDSTFVAAWHLLWAVLANAGASPAEQRRALSASYRLRSGLPSVGERTLVEANYLRVSGDLAGAVAKYKAVLSGPTRVTGRANGEAENNLGSLYRQLREFDLALRYFASLRDTTGSDMSVADNNYVTTLVSLGRLDEARREVQRYDSLAGPDNPQVRPMHYAISNAERRPGEVLVQATRYADTAESDDARLAASLQRRTALLTLGRLREASQVEDARREIFAARHSASNVLAGTVLIARARAEMLGDSAGAARALADARARVKWDSLDAMDRPYQAIITVLARLGRVAEARAMLADYEHAIPAEWRKAFVGNMATAAGEVALAEHNGKAALAAYRKGDVGTCVACAFAQFAAAFDLMQQPDSAIVWNERFVQARTGGTGAVDAFYLARAYKRLGELYEERRDYRRAIQRYGDFVELWKNADPELQPVVRDVKERIARLQRKAG